tara:strand:- start:4986 stop:5225 length:240 start_codon:yes stop_codon:yes gene_type:complete
MDSKFFLDKVEIDQHIFLQPLTEIPIDVIDETTEVLDSRVEALIKTNWDPISICPVSNLPNEQQSGLANLIRDEPNLMP